MNRQIKLARRFRDQEAFASGYSPLYARLFGSVANWLSSAETTGDPVVSWLLLAGRGRPTLDITLLLAAGLHRDVLTYAKSSEASAAIARLANYFPTVGCAHSPDDPDFERALRQAILDRQEPLQAFIQHARVQTNETGRGLCWLLPLLATGWETVDLIDLGASAGLNLVADQRRFGLISAGSERRLLDIGRAGAEQFILLCQGDLDALRSLETKALPAIASRTGIDLAPFALTKATDEIILMSFVWGDQVNRMQRLREGIEAVRQAENSAAPVALHPVHLPDELGHFLQQFAPADSALPVVIYNTVMTIYLSDKGKSMGGIIDHWALKQDRPVLWIQWEPIRNGATPPEFGYFGWTVELWRGETHRRWQIGWVHPHGTAVEFGPGLAEWLNIW